LEASTRLGSLGTGLALSHCQDMTSSAIHAADSAVKSGFVYGHSPAIQGLNATVREIAATDIPVLLFGESGTGKEVYGRLIHRLSKHSHAPMKKLNCRTLEPGELLESWRTHCEGNSETSKDNLRTLFLDGIDELDLTCQKILISLLPDGESNENRDKRERLIASSCCNLDQEIEAGRFRRELYFRISGVCLHLPPLRDRKDDIPVLMEHFLAKHAAPGAEVPLLSEAEVAFLRTHDWPGNIRELENVARKITALGQVRKALDGFRPVAKVESRLPEDPQEFSLKVAARAASRQAERELIARALEKTHWNRKRAARDLRISYKSLLYKIKQTGLEASKTDQRIKEG
jgi:two-component system response regulator AtoC